MAINLRTIAIGHRTLYQADFHAITLAQTPKAFYLSFIATGPAEYMAAIFRKLTDSDEAATQLALEFYGPMFLLYSVYDGASDKEGVAPILGAYIDRFISERNLGGKKI